MQITETNAEGLKREFTVTVASNDIERKMQDRLSEIGRTIRLPGFRPGKVPMPVLRKRYGASVMGEVLEKAVSDSSAQAMREHNLRPAMQPKIEIVSFKEGTDLEYKMAVELLPEIKPIDFSQLQLERLRPEIPEAEIDKAIQRIAEPTRKTEAVDRPATSRLSTSSARSTARNFPAAAPRATRWSSAPAASFRASRTSSSASRRASIVTSR
jgi:trigger factor